MSEKFSQILKIKKQNLDKIALALSQNRAEARRIEGFISDSTKEIASIKFPKSGEILEIQGSVKLLNLALKQKQNLLERLELVKKSIMHYEHQYKRANLEYEKIKYLQSEELKKHMAKLKRAEQNLLDEFGVIRHSYLKEDES